MKRLFVDVQTYGGEEVARVGVYCYSERHDFRGLLLGYAMDDGPVQIVDIAHGETIPAEVRKALFDSGVAKVALNARYARICLSRLLHLPMNAFLPAEQWRCQNAHLAYMGLPADMKQSGKMLSVNADKYCEMQEVVKRFCLAARYESFTDYMARMKASSFRWQTFREYVRESVALARNLSKELEQTPMPSLEWECYALNERINDVGVDVDSGFVRSAIACDRQYRRKYLDLLYSLTGMDYASADNLRVWLKTQGIGAASLSRDALRHYRLTASADVRDALEIWRFLSMTSTQKYQRIARALCRDGRLRGLFAYCGGRNGRFGSGIVQTSNLPVSRLSELSHIRHRIRKGAYDDLESRCGSVYDALAGLLTTVFVPDIGCHLIAAEYVALEACVLHWLSGLCGDSYNASNPGSASEALSRRIESAVADCFGKKGVAVMGNLKFWLDAGNLKVQLPSGRVQTYWNVEPVYDCDSRLLVIYDSFDRKGRSRRDTADAWNLTGDIVQGTARDAWVNMMVNLDRSGHFVVMHRPDAVVIEAASDTALSEVCDVVRQNPSWADGLALSFRACRCERYLEKTLETTRHT